MDNPTRLVTLQSEHLIELQLVGEEAPRLLHRRKIAGALYDVRLVTIRRRVTIFTDGTILEREKGCVSFTGTVEAIADPTLRAQAVLHYGEISNAAMDRINARFEEHFTSLVDETID